MTGLELQSSKLEGSKDWPGRQGWGCGARKTGFEWTASFDLSGTAAIGTSWRFPIPSIPIQEDQTSFRATFEALKVITMKLA